jgi:hypothetical protein
VTAAAAPQLHRLDALADTRAFPLACYGTSLMLAVIEFAIDAAYLPSGTALGPLWRGYAAGLGDFIYMVAGMWAGFALVALGLRRLRGMARRERLVSSALAGVFAYLGLAAMANLESRMTTFPQMSDTMLLVVTLAVPTVLSAVIAPLVVRTLAMRRDKAKAARAARN